MYLNCIIVIHLVKLLEFTFKIFNNHIKVSLQIERKIKFTTLLFKIKFYISYKIIDKNETTQQIF